MEIAVFTSRRTNLRNLGRGGPHVNRLLNV